MQDANDINTNPLGVLSGDIIFSDERAFIKVRKNMLCGLKRIPLTRKKLSHAQPISKS